LLLLSVALVDLVLNLVEEAERLIGWIAGLEGVEALLEALLWLLLLLLGDLLLGELLLLRLELLLLLRESLLLRNGLRLLLLEGLLWPLLLKWLLLRPLLLECRLLWLLWCRFGLRIDGTKLCISGKRRNRLAAFV
jgi:hypothetical protein